MDLSGTNETKLDLSELDLSGTNETKGRGGSSRKS